MPHVLKQYLNESSFLQMRARCCRARSRQEFEGIVSEFNATFGIDNAIQAIEIGHTMAEVVGAFLYAPIGLTIGAGWTGFKQPLNRMLRVDTGVLNRIRHAFPVAGVSGGHDSTAYQQEPVQAEVHVVGVQGMPVVKAEYVAS